MSDDNINSDMEDEWNDLDLEDPELQRLLDEPIKARDTSNLRTNEQHAGFDDKVGGNWIYPTNLAHRTYQYSIVQSALYKNCLVVLPTGLGKTFIAAVVMYNIYRWYPMGKVIFMAPTRPLVAQQIEACKRIMPFPKQDTVELTGKLPKPRRAELWRTKRVFFATPHVVQSDIFTEGNSSEFPFEQIKLVVIDEAHKAKGRYAYTEVVRAISERNRYFRVLALSATPGRTIDDVAEVVRNLYISNLEVRWENSIDVMPYVHQRSLKTIAVPMSDEIKQVREELIEMIDPFERQLIDAGVINGSCTNINRFFLIMAQKNFQSRSQHERHPQQAAISTNFSICISLYHALELLERHGLRVFLNHFDCDDEGRSKFVVSMVPRLQNLIERLRTELGPNPFDVSTSAMTNGQIAEMPKNLDFGHPKFEHAREALLKHFEEQPDSRAIVFCEYRESVMLIYRLLLQNVPLLKPRCFVGQGGTGSIRALTQKQQIQIMNDFRSGKSNILIATSIGEEGIDVGEVELIICFDICTSNPTRFVQRIGRTGRKKNGKVLLLVTEGREQQVLKDVLANRDTTNKKLLNSTIVKGALYKHAPRLVPTEINPQCQKTFIEPLKEDDLDLKSSTSKKKPQETKSKKGISKKETKKTIVKEKNKKIPDSQDLRNFFSKAVEPIEEEPKPSRKPVKESQQQQQQQQNCMQKTLDNLYKEIDDLVSRIDCDAILQGQLPEQKEIENFFKIMESAEALIPKSERPKDLLTNLKSTKYMKESKILALQTEPEFVKNVMDKIDIVMALNQEDGMSKEEKDIRDSYDILISLFENREGIQKFLEDNMVEKRESEEEDADKDENENENDENICDCEMFKEENEKLMAALIEELDLPPDYKTNREFWKKHAEEAKDFEKMLDEKLAALLQVTSLDEIKEEDDFDTLTDSKYCSQWGESTQEQSKRPGSSIIEKTKQKSAIDSELVDKILNSLTENVEVEKDSDEDVIYVPPDKSVFNLSATSNQSNKSFTKPSCSKDSKKLFNSGTPLSKQMNLAPLFNKESTPKFQKSLGKTSKLGNKSVDPFSETAHSFVTVSSLIEQQNSGSVNRNFKLSPILENKVSSKNNSLKASTPVHTAMSTKTSKVSPIFCDESSLVDLNIHEKSKETSKPDSQLMLDLKKECEASKKSCDDSQKVEKLTSEGDQLDLTIKNELLTQRTKENATDERPTYDLDVVCSKLTELFNTSALDNNKPSSSQKQASKTDTTTPDENLLHFSDGFDLISFLNDTKPPQVQQINKELYASSLPPTIKFELSPDLDDKITPRNDLRISTSKSKPHIKDTNTKLLPSVENKSSPQNKPSISPYGEKSSLNTTQECKIETKAEADLNKKSFFEDVYVDFNDFLEPFPEEVLQSENTVQIPTSQTSNSSLKENVNEQIFIQSHERKILSSDKTSTVQHTLNKICENQKSNLPNKKTILGQQMSSPLPKTPPRQNKINSPSMASPQQQKILNTHKVEISPTVFDRYMSNRSKKSSRKPNLAKLSTTVSTAAPVVGNDESAIIPQRKSSKRKIFDSSESDEDDKISFNKISDKDIETDCEEIAATQQVHRKKRLQYRSKRFKHCSFIDNEAAVSGSDQSDDVEEDTLGQIESFLGSSDEEGSHIVPGTQMQAVYLQSVKSPVINRGGFKLPAQRVFNDESHIFSQAVPEEPSHYEKDSFVVDEEEADNNKDTSLCPLERAEKILKQRRRDRHKFPQVAEVQRRRKKIIVIDDSSDDD
ncbi:Fanconi anemia group M protein [Teleopsis dalmanni]|uniref:Fanconi anemia group M protein n=1 Tax=Teleopsis dalmanni TaxID=139649 RepID=UPI0018CE71EF|nr:Fanconi anemia group M protein [Teleopsis dalmanni]